MSAESNGLLEFIRSRSCRALASRSAFCPRAAAICGGRDLRAHFFDFAGQPVARGAGLVLFHHLLHAEVGFGDGIGDAGRKVRVGRAEIDDDHTRFFHRVDIEAIVISFQRTLVSRHRAQITSEADHPEERPQYSKAARRRIELLIVGKHFFLDDFAREVAREQQLHLARHRFRIDRCAIAALVGFGAQKYVLTPFEQQPRLRLIARRDCIDDKKGQPGGEKREAEDARLFLPQVPAKAAQVWFTVCGERRRHRDWLWRGIGLRLSTEQHSDSERTTLLSKCSTPWTSQTTLLSKRTSFKPYSDQTRLWLLRR